MHKKHLWFIDLLKEGMTLHLEVERYRAHHSNDEIIRDEMILTINKGNEKTEKRVILAVETGSRYSYGNILSAEQKPETIILLPEEVSEVTG